MSLSLARWQDQGKLHFGERKAAQYTSPLISALALEVTEFQASKLRLPNQAVEPPGLVGESVLYTHSNQLKVKENGEATGIALKPPTTTAGDVIYADSATTTTRLPIGGVGQVLSVNGGLLPAWTSIAGVTPVSTISVGIQGTQTTLGVWDIQYTSVGLAAATWEDLTLQFAQILAGTGNLSWDGANFEVDVAATGRYSISITSIVGRIASPNRGITFGVGVNGAVPTAAASAGTPFMTTANQPYGSTLNQILELTSGDSLKVYFNHPSGAPEDHTFYKVIVNVVGTIYFARWRFAGGLIFFSTDDRLSTSLSASTSADRFAVNSSNAVVMHGKHTSPAGPRIMQTVVRPQERHGLTAKRMRGGDRFPDSGTAGSGMVSKSLSMSLILIWTKSLPVVYRIIRL